MQEEVRILLALLDKARRDDDQTIKRHAQGLYARIIEVTYPFSPDSTTD